jgi:hypothetical protein
MKKIILWMMMITFVSGLMPVYATGNELSTKSKAEVIENILNVARSIYEAAPRQEGKKVTGLNYDGLIYTTYPKIKKDVREKLISENLAKIKLICEKYTVEELDSGLESFKRTLKEHAAFEWLPKYQEPKYVNLVYLEMPLEDCFKYAFIHKEFIRKEEEAKTNLESYQDNWKSGMISPWAKEDVEKVIAGGYVPKHLQDNYQLPITREEFAELFVCAVFASFNKHNAGYDQEQRNYWEFYKLDVDNFLSKVSTTEYFIDTDSKYVTAANILGMMNGNENHRFNPTGLITREEAAVIIMNYAQTLRGLGIHDADEELGDIHTASSWSKAAVKWAYSNEFIDSLTKYEYDGYKVTKKGHFDTKGLFTREQALLTLGNMGDDMLNHLILRGFVRIGMDELMSGFDIDKDSIKMKKSGYDSKSYAIYKYNNDQDFKKTSYLLKYKSEALDAALLTPPGAIHDMHSIYQLDKVLTGKQTYYDYGLFTVEHNKDGYLAVVTKKENTGYFYGNNPLQYMNDGKLKAVELLNDDNSQTSSSFEQDIALSHTITDKERNTYLGEINNVYPQQWITINSSGELEYTDQKPIGTVLGYALETDTSIYLNGKYVKSYNIGGKNAIALDALKDFGFTYELKSSSFNYNGHVVRQGEIRLYKPVKSDFKHYSDSKVIKSDVLVGNPVHTLVGDEYGITLWDKNTNSSLGGMRSFTSTSGERFILIDELWNDMYYSITKSNKKNNGMSSAFWYSVKGSKFADIVLYNNDLAIVDNSDTKHIYVQLLSDIESEELKNRDGRAEKYYIANHFPKLIDRVLSEDERQAWQAAAKIVNEVVKPGMTEKEKVHAIQGRMRSHGHLIEGMLIVQPMINYSNYDSAYEALVEKFSNYAGWFDAYKMVFTLAGLETFPPGNVEAAKREFDDGENQTNTIAVRVDGVWECVEFLPPEYDVSSYHNTK